MVSRSSSWASQPDFITLGQHSLLSLYVKKITVILPSEAWNTPLIPGTSGVSDDRGRNDIQAGGCPWLVQPTINMLASVSGVWRKT